MFHQSFHAKLITIILFTAILFLATGCLKQGNPAAVRELKEPITLKYWRVFDGQDSFNEIINNYKRFHPNVNIEYRKLKYDEYEQALLEAWAEDRGPDIFSIHNTWLRKYKNKILPLPDTIKLPYVIKRNKRTGEIEKGGYKENRAWTPFDIRNKFVETVYQDVVIDNQIFGLPLSVDSLALFYNRTMLDAAQITKIPNTWLEVKEDVKKLTLQDESGNIIQSGIALGTGNNINRATDILSLLMMQNGAQMTDASGRRAIFDELSPYSADKNYRPGAEALRFYTDFALPFKEVYSWNKEMPEAVNAFITGRLAMFLGYSYQLPLIKTQGSKLNIGISGVPHINADATDAIGNNVNFASYWVETVAKKTKHPNYAWNFLMFAVNDDQAIKYLTKTKKPTALRALVKQQLNDPDIAPFANQVLTARSWYRGLDPQTTESIFKEMIEQVISGKNTVQEAIRFAAKRVNQTF